MHRPVSREDGVQRETTPSRGHNGHVCVLGHCIPWYLLQYQSLVSHSEFWSYLFAGAHSFLGENTVL